MLREHVGLPPSLGSWSGAPVHTHGSSPASPSVAPRPPALVVAVSSCPSVTLPHPVRLSPGRWLRYIRLLLPPGYSRRQRRRVPGRVAAPGHPTGHSSMPACCAGSADGLAHSAHRPSTPVAGAPAASVKLVVAAT